MVHRAYAVVGAASTAVLVTVVAASLSPGSIFGSHQVDGDRSSAPQPVHHRPASGAGGDGPIATWLMVTMTTLLGIYVLALVAFLIFHRRGRKDDEDRGDQVEDAERLNAAWRTILPVELGNAAETQLGLLHLGTPRNAIVACWMGLQAATVGAGLPEISSETSEEFMLRAVHSLGLDPPAITTLAALYREARFSEHEMLESQRDQAGQALGVLAVQVAEPAADRRTDASSNQVLEGVMR